MKKFIIEKGYFDWKKGWQYNENGCIFAVIPVDVDLNQVGDGDIALELNDIPNTIRRINQRIEESV
jgi:IS30 family transposase